MVSGIGGKSGGFLRNLQRADDEKQSAFRKLSSGSRVTKASDDAAGLAIFKSLEADVAALEQASRNIGDFESLINVAEGSLGEISNITQRMDELAIQASNGTLGDSQRAALSQEFNALRAEVGRISSTTSFNGIKPLDGSQGALSAQAGIEAGPDSRISVSTPNVTSLASSLDSLDISTVEGARSALGSIDDFRNSVSSARGDLGAANARLLAARENVETASLNSEQAASSIRDVDVADQAAKLVAANIRSQVGVALNAQANQSSQLVLRLLA